jgi:hypothetical protein
MVQRAKEIPKQQKRFEQVASVAAKVASPATNTSQQKFPRFPPCCSGLVSVGIYFTKLRNVFKNEKV